MDGLKTLENLLINASYFIRSVVNLKKESEDAKCFVVILLFL